MRRICKLGFVVVGTLAAAAGIAAEIQPGMYIGIGGGRTTHEVSSDDYDRLASGFMLPFLVRSGPPTAEDSDSGFALFGGYRFNRYLAVEAAYVTLGEAQLSASGRLRPFVPGFVFNSTNSVEIETTGFSVAAVGSLPLGTMFDIHGRIGLLMAKTDYRMTVSYGEQSETNSKSSQPMLFGAGTSAHLGTNWSVGLDWTRFESVGAEDKEFDVDLIAVSAAYRF